MKVISPAALLALREALPSIVWFRNSFETYVRAALAGHTALLSGVTFSPPTTKREASDIIVDRLIADQNRYFDVTIELMVAIASMDSFPDIEKIKDPAEREERLLQANNAVEELAKHTAGFAQERERATKRAAARKADAAGAAAAQKFSTDLEAIKDRFFNLHSMTDAQERGRQFERLLTDLFELFDLEPRFSYVLDGEQIDGSFSYDTDNYIVEANWTKAPIGRPDLDVFDAKVRRRGKNALGAFFSMRGYTSTALDKFSEGAAFIAFDGQDLMLVLEGRVRLDEVLRNKKRHVNDTGSCMVRTTDWLVG